MLPPLFSGFFHKSTQFREIRACKISGFGGLETDSGQLSCKRNYDQASRVDVEVIFFYS